MSHVTINNTNVIWMNDPYNMVHIQVGVRYKWGIFMLNEIQFTWNVKWLHEIFDILYFDFESVGFNLVKYKNFDDLVHAINNGKCPVVDVLKEHYSSEKDGSHVMVATGIKHKDGVRCIQLKNSFADNPNEQGTVQSTKFII